MKDNELKVGDKFTWNTFEEFGVFTVTDKYTEFGEWFNKVVAVSESYGEGLFGGQEVTLVSTTQPRTLKELDTQVGDVVETPYGSAQYEVFEGNKLKNLKNSYEPFCFSEYWDTTYFNLVSRATGETTTLTKPQIEVGKTYKSNSGREWECIFVEGTVAYLRQSSSEALAYAWNVDGTAIWFKDYSDNIKFEPIVLEGVDTISSGVVHVGNDEVSINGTVTTVDGVPDWTTYKEGN